MRKAARSKGEDTRQVLMDISKELFAVKSFDSVTVDEICRKAGVTKGSFYHHFSSKYDIPIQQYRAIQNEFYLDFEANASLPVLERLAKAIAWYAGYCTEDKINIITNYHRVMMNYDKNRILRKIEIETKVFTELLGAAVAEGAIRSDIIVEFQAEVISRFIASLLLDWAIFKGALDLAGELERLHENFLKTFAKPQAG